MIITVLRHMRETTDRVEYMYIMPELHCLKTLILDQQHAEEISDSQADQLVNAGMAIDDRRSQSNG